MALIRFIGFPHLGRVGNSAVLCSVKSKVYAIQVTYMDAATINFWVTNPWVILLTYIIAVIGIVLSLILYFKSKKERVPCYEVSCSTLIDGMHRVLEGLEVRYRDQPQSRITVALVTLWNAGRETIDRNDFVPASPISIMFSSAAEILDVRVAVTSSEGNIVHIGEPKKTASQVEIPLDFEYLDHNDYFVIQIVHNGSVAEKFSFAGKIKGARLIRRVSSLTDVEPAFMSAIREMPLKLSLIRNRRLLIAANMAVYLGGALLGIWLLVHGRTEWYTWGGTILSAFIGVSVPFVIPKQSPRRR
ncbi:MAG: hypothetical protein ACXWJK_09160 [Burkholderiaceae bacterium]